MKQQAITKLQLILDQCDAEDRSTEFTIEFLQDMGNVSFDTAMDFLQNHAYEGGA